jgi:hypothetical protein
LSDNDPYQRGPQIKQAEAEIENAEALGLPDRVAAAKKTLAALREDAGVKRAAAKGGTSEDSAPTGRSSRQAQQVTTDKK